MGDAANGGKWGMSGNAIEIEGLRKTYAGQKGTGPKDALKGIDLKVEIATHRFCLAC